MSATSPPLFSPTQLSGCSLWFDGADTSTLSLSGSSVTQWNDKSGNGYTATGTVAPTYNSATRYVVFNGSSQYCTVSAGAYPTGNNPYSIFIVAYTNSPADPQWIISGGTRNTNQAIGVLFYITDGIWHSWWANEYRLNNVVTNQAPILINTSYSSSTRTTITNGTTVLTNSPGTTRSNQSSPNYISSMPNPIGQHLNGGVGEIVIFNSEIPVSQRQQMEGYLAWKWGLVGNLPANHPYKTTPVFSAGYLPYAPFPIQRTSIPVPVFSPLSIAGCSLWLDATDRTTLGLTGSTVTSWRDKSGTVSAPTVTGSPSYIQSSNLNGLSAVSFNGSSDTLFYTLSVSQPLTVFGVTVQRLAANTAYSFVLEPSVGNAAVILYRDGPILYFYAGNAVAASPTVNFSNNITGVYTAIFNGSSSLLGFNGSSSSSNLNAGTFAWSNLYLGRDWSGIYQSQDVGEVLFYNSALTTTQRQQVEGYLAWKWGLTASLPNGHPYKTPPIAPFSYGVRQSSLGRFSPLSITGCSLWLDAADLTALSLSGTNVTQWNDKSGNGRNAVVSSNAFATYSNTGLFFNNSYYTTSYTGSPTNESFFSVFTTVPILNIGSNGLVGTQSGGRTILVGHGGNSNISGGSNVFGMNASGVYAGAAVSGLVGNTRFIGLIQVSGGTTTTASLNGSNLSLPITFAGLTGGRTTTFGRETATTQAFNGFSHEFVVYGSVLTTFQRQQVEGYLAWKWGLVASLPATHPYKLYPPPPS